MKGKSISSQFKIPSHLDPPGCMRQILRSPSQPDECIELAVFKEHRFAFFYWNKWTNELNGEVPSLITFDWHQDLAPPYIDQLEGLRALDVKNNGEVAFYSWAELSHFNDVQIHSAVLLNKVKDVYVICRQQTSRPKEYIIKDFEGNEHNVSIFDSLKEFEKNICQIIDRRLYFDIDLDYFTLSNPLSLGCPFEKREYAYLKKTEIIGLLSIGNPVMKWIFDRLAGFTIATEPEFCGGLKKSNDLLQTIDSLYFSPSLFCNLPGGIGTEWKHLRV